MTNTYRHKNTKPCHSFDRACPICYPINDRTARTRRRYNRVLTDEEKKEAFKTLQDVYDYYADLESMSL